MNRKRAASLKKPAAKGVLKHPACYVIEDSDEPEEDDLESALDREIGFYDMHLGFKRLNIIVTHKVNRVWMKK